MAHRADAKTQWLTNTDTGAYNGALSTWCTVTYKHLCKIEERLTLLGQDRSHFIFMRGPAIGKISITCNDS